MKYISPILVSFSFCLTLVTNYQFEQDTSGRLLTRVLHTFMGHFSSPPEGSFMVATPFYQDNQFATFVFIFISLSVLLFVCVKEISIVLSSGKNKKSAYLLTMTTAIIFFNVKLAIWNT